jgi:RNA-directed DNA polymerase
MGEPVRIGDRLAQRGGWERLAVWLAPRGLTFNEDKTRIIDLDQGFDFLGFNVRRYHGKLLIKPSQAAIRRIRKRLRTEIRALRGAHIIEVLKRLNPIIRGWSAYYRTAVSSQAFAALDDYLWKLTNKWATRRHRNKSKHWVTARYFGAFHPSRRDQWVFGDRDSGAYLLKFAWTKIVRHQIVKDTASPDDPDLDQYWAVRRRRRPPVPLNRTDLRLLKDQDGRCPLCTDLLLHADQPPQTPQEWEQWLASDPNSDEEEQPRRLPDARHAGRHPTPSRAHLLPTKNRRQEPSNSAHPRAITACSSRVRLTPHARF